MNLVNFPGPKWPPRSVTAGGEFLWKPMESPAHIFTYFEGLWYNNFNMAHLERYS